MPRFLFHKAKGKNDLLARQVCNMANEPIRSLLLPFAFARNALALRRSRLRFLLRS
jgi:hypothetical protein